MEDPKAGVTKPTVPVPGDPKGMQLKAVEAGTSMLQGLKPIKQIHQHVCAIHMYAHDATRQVLAHHFCCCLNDEMRQCVLYDSDGPDARLIGIEYIISRRMFEDLPEEEKKYWHSHVYEVKSGMLVAPGVPTFAEDQDMQKVINTYGKIWHFWQVDRGDPLPYGPPSLMMALVQDGQMDEKIIEKRDKMYKMSTAEVRAHRAYMQPEQPPDMRADHPWHTGKAWQATMQETEFNPGKALMARDRPATDVSAPKEGQD